LLFRLMECKGKVPNSFFQILFLFFLKTSAGIGNLAYA